MTTTDIALLVLEDGTVFKGRAWGARGRTLGEIVFSTGMTGYQETLTDPSYHRQIVVMTAPHIGNTGVNDEDPESSRIWVAGFIVRDAARRASNWRARRELEDELIAQGIVGLADVDTRAITRHIRERGAMRAGIFSGDALPAGAQYMGDEALASLVRIVSESPVMSGQALAAEVSTDETYVVEPLGDYEGKEPLARVVAVDLGIKSRTPYHLAARGARVYVVPSTVSFADIEALHPDGVFFSNGPGDPSTADREIGLLAEEILAVVYQTVRSARNIVRIERGHAEHFARALGITRSDERRVDVDKVSLLEEAVDGKGDDRAHAEGRLKQIRAGTQV